MVGARKEVAELYGPLHEETLEIKKKKFKTQTLTEEQEKEVLIATQRLLDNKTHTLMYQSISVDEL